MSRDTWFPFLAVLQMLLGYLIPDVPEHVRLRLERERHLQRQAFKEHELGADREEKKVDLVNVQAEEEDEGDAFLDGLPPDAALRQLLDGTYAANNRAAAGGGANDRPCPFFLLLFKKITLFC